VRDELHSRQELQFLSQQFRKIDPVSFTAFTTPIAPHLDEFKSKSSLANVCSGLTGLRLARQEICELIGRIIGNATPENLQEPRTC